MHKFLPFLIISILFASCNLFTQKKEKKSDVNDKISLINADKAFSKMSEEKGMKTAFMEYIDSNGVLLRPNEMPIIGANAIDYLSQQSDTDYTLVWEPRGGNVAQSGELGYTYGIYAMHPKSADTTIYGTYVSIWKKQADGTWRFVLDSENQGVDNDLNSTPEN
jgi:ketosteroid isomerase-like protein